MITQAFRERGFQILGEGLSTFINGLEGVVDAHPDEQHSIKVNVTRHPVEDGSSLTDNAVVAPSELTLEGWVSDLLSGNNSIVDIGGAGRATEAWGRIEDLARKREPLTVVTSLKVYENMLITSVSCTKDKDTGRALRFKISLEEVVFAQTELVKFSPDSVDQNSSAADKTSTVNGGKKQSYEASQEQIAAIQEAFKNRNDVDVIGRGN